MGRSVSRGVIVFVKKVLRPTGAVNIVIININKIVIIFIFIPY